MYYKVRIHKGGEIMKVYELTITLLLKKNIHFQGINEALGAYISRSMLHDEELSKLHRKKESKLYIFSGLYPVESKTKVYQEGKVYIFRLRSLREKFTDVLARCIRKQQDPVFQIIAIERRLYGRRAIQELYSATPFIVTVDGGPWLQTTGDVDLLMERLSANAEKKYQDAFQEKLTNNSFIQRIEFINEKPIAMSYKNVRLLGNKIRIEVNSDTDSQKLAYTVLGAGMGEKGSSLGAGFCFANFV